MIESKKGKRRPQIPEKYLRSRPEAASNFRVRGVHVCLAAGRLNAVLEGQNFPGHGAE